MKDVDVICQIKSDGSIIPIRIKLEDEEKQLQIFNIKRYKAPKEYLRSETSGHNDGKFPFSDMLEYQCVIVVFEREKIITIRYVLSAHKWILIT